MASVQSIINLPYVSSLNAACSGSIWAAWEQANHSERSVHFKCSMTVSNLKRILCWT